MASLKIGLKTAFALFSCALLQACVSTSLEDAAPRRDAEKNSPTVLENTSNNDVAVHKVDDPLESQASGTLQTQTLATETFPKYDKQGYPTFAETPKGEVDQLSSPEKNAIETKMTELLLRRSTNENVRANFEAKLRYLRKLAKTHEQNADTIISQ
ncbi:hypothetical protein [Lentilitoribacter sp. EG35]|uniref:hypothetical protein n=1 Tax=Lentilitoribacter sp. EG35 TaxID=3234192 RepID=UPI00345FADC7